MRRAAWRPGAGRRMRPRLPPFLMCCASPIAVLVLLLCGRAAHAGTSRLTPREARAYAYRVGGATLVSIIHQESSFCRYRIGDDDTSLGCGQLKLDTARMFAPNITRWRLIHDDRLNIRLAWAYFQAAEAQTGSWTAAVYAYNKGIPQATAASWAALLHDPYVRAIERSLGR